MRPGDRLIVRVDPGTPEFRIKTLKAELLDHFGVHTVVLRAESMDVTVVQFK